jgi:hypothetical protein
MLIEQGCTMTNLHPGTTGRKPRTRPKIPLPDGETLEPRKEWAASVGISDKTAQRMNLETVYIASVAYVKKNASTQELGDRARRRNEPKHRTR